VVELVYTADLKSAAFIGLRVRLPPVALEKERPGFIRAFPMSASSLDTMREGGIFLSHWFYFEAGNRTQSGHSVQSTSCDGRGQR
jgi:hypothetical protein